MDSSSVNDNILNAIGWTLIVGSVYAIVLLVIYSRKYPAQRESLTKRIVRRRWKGREAAAILTGFSVLMVLLPLVYVLAGGDDTALAQLIIILIYSSTQLLILVAIGRYRKRDWAADFGMSLRQLRILPLSFTIYLAILPVLGLSTLFYHGILERLFGVEVQMQDAALLITESHAWIRAGLILLSVFAAPLYEEMIFRGVFFPYLIPRIGFYPAMLTVSGVFAAMHFHVPSMLPLFLLSVALCAAYWRTGSLWTSIGLHALFNGVSIILLLLTS